METLADASDYLEGLINHERRPGFAYARLDLKPIRALLDRLGRPEEALSVIHVAGSKGKGSTCLFTESILLALGERVGCFTSPHLESWVERFRIDAEPIDPPRLVDAVRRVRPIVDELLLGPRETVPSFFDATTAVAFLLFAEASVDRALIEVGLGGRLDSTNVVNPDVTCITSIELEHTDKLGETETAIAGEKAGILKPNRPVVLGALGSEAGRVIRSRAEEMRADVFARDEHYSLRRATDDTRLNSFLFQTSPAVAEAFEVEIDLDVPGEAAVGNAGLAIGCVLALDRYSKDELQRATREGLGGCSLPARIEVLANDPAVIVDAAHTAESARTLAEALGTLAPNGFEMILSVSSDKNLSALLDALLPRTRRIWLTQAEPLRSMTVDVLEKSVRARAPDLAIEVVKDPAEAARQARAALPADVHLCAAGSIYLAGVVRRVLGPETSLS